jgi:hypothetical protein
VPDQGPDQPQVTSPLPILSFGPWTYPHSSPDGCHPLGYTGGATSDAWPFGMCTLRDVRGAAAGADVVANPPMEKREGGRQAGAAGVRAGGGQQGAGMTWCRGARLTLPAPSPRPRRPTAPAAGRGWVSGTVGVPDRCDGVSPVACAACLATQRPDECLACARDARAQPASRAAFLSRRGAAGGGAVAGDAQRGCAVCANVTAKAERDM